jgi:Ser/Thr protein kinase RdoA (MazF antagonist)
MEGLVCKHNQMINFKKQRIIEIAEKCYGEKPRIKKQYPSENNSVYLLQFKESEKVIKIAGRKYDWVIDKEIYLFNLLKQKHIPVPKVEFFDTVGKFIPHHWLIMNKAGDKELNQFFWSKAGNFDELCLESGRIFARIHSITFKKQGFILVNKVQEESFYDYSKKLFEERTHSLVRSKKLTKQEVSKARKVFDDFSDSPEKCLCHNDFGPWQVLVRDNKISGVIDWEFARSSSSVYDFAKSELMTNTWSGKFNLFRTVRKGYESIRKLPKDYDNIRRPYQIVEALNMMNFFKDRKRKFAKIKGEFLILIS